MDLRDLEVSVGGTAARGARSHCRERKTEQHQDQHGERGRRPPTGPHILLEPLRRPVASRRLGGFSARGMDEGRTRRALRTSRSRLPPATIPAVVRTSRNPKRLIRNDNRYPPRVAIANPAPAAAARRLLDTRMIAPRTNAVITWSRNSQPIVGIVR